MAVPAQSPSAGPPSAPALSLPFENSYTQLPEHLFARVTPVPAREPRLIQLNVELAHQLSLDPDQLASPAGVAVLAGSAVAPGSQPLALSYSGHQFGHFVPLLGDGRAHLLGELIGTDGIRYDLQLKGSGPTPFSRRGDGRAALGPVLREYLLSEFLAAFGIPSTRSLAAVLTGEAVYRESIFPGAVLARVASSHLRIGTFQRAALAEGTEDLRLLANYAIARHFTSVPSDPLPYTAFLHGVIARQASLVAQWMLIGFVHGVMNTDNISISGETLDFGPCAFLETYNPGTVFSSIDQNGRYAFSNQPHAALWNLTRLAEALLPLLIAEQGSEEAGLAAANQALATFIPNFNEDRLGGLRRKLGLSTAIDTDSALAEDLLTLMTQHDADFTKTFRLLTDVTLDPARDATLREVFHRAAPFDAWRTRWHQRLAQEDTSPDVRGSLMQRANPLYIPRNHLVDAALRTATETADFRSFQELLSVLANPCREQLGRERFAEAALPSERIHQTFCGT